MIHTFLLLAALKCSIILTSNRVNRWWPMLYTEKLWGGQNSHSPQRHRFQFLVVMLKQLSVCVHDVGSRLGMMFHNSNNSSHLPPCRCSRWEEEEIKPTNIWERRSQKHVTQSNAIFHEHFLLSMFFGGFVDCPVQLSWILHSFLTSASGKEINKMKGFWRYGIAVKDTNSATVIPKQVKTQCSAKVI